jgi:hypothetical protein
MYCCGYTSWVYHRQYLDPASPGGPRIVTWHVARRAAQLLLILKDEVQPRIGKPDPNRPSEEVGSVEAHMEPGSNTTYKGRRILDVHGKTLYRS